MILSESLTIPGILKKKNHFNVVVKTKLCDSIKNAILSSYIIFHLVVLALILRLKHSTV
jgi:hypothetical protein